MRIYTFVLSILLVGFAGFFMTFHTTNPTPLPSPLNEFPVEVAQWRLVREEIFSQEALNVLRPTEYLYRRYVRPDGSAVNLYIGYHDGARNAGQIHSPKNCLPGGGWFQESSRTTSLELPGGRRMPLEEAVYRQGDAVEVMLYWFEAGGVQVTNEYAFKLKEIENSVFRGRRDAVFVRIGVSAGRDTLEQSFQVARSFLYEAWPSLKAYLPS